MIGKTLQNILNEKNINVNELSKMTGVSNQTLYSIIKRDNMKVDLEVLIKICSALNVDIEVFYSDYLNKKEKAPAKAEAAADDVDTLYNKLVETLINVGVVKEGQDITDEQLAILETISRLISAYF